MLTDDEYAFVGYWMSKMAESFRKDKPNVADTADRIAAKLRHPSTPKLTVVK